jgi:NADPH-ferrihemoprotein reductase
MQAKDIVVFWGSQSGTAEAFATRLVRDLRSRFGLEALSADLSDYEPDSIANIPPTKFAIFLVSTYGEGDPSDNTAQLFSWISKEQPTCFNNLRYAAFGLGNSKYKFYNRVIDVIVEGLDKLGARAIVRTGRADDANGGTEEDFNDWKQSLFNTIRTDLGIEERAAVYEPALKVVEDTSLDLIDLHAGQPVKPRSNKIASSEIHALPVKAARQLFTTTDRNCLHVEVDISEHAELKYKTGDHLAVWPSNPLDEVSRLINILGLEETKRTPLLIQSLDPQIQAKVPSPTTAEVLLKYYLEVCAPVSRETILALASFASSPVAKTQLTHLASSREAYQLHCASTHVTLARLLESVTTLGESWSHLPLSFVIEVLPALAPRYYSISSSSIVSPKTIAITVATATHNAHNLPVPGLTTSYLSAVHQTLNPATVPSLTSEGKISHDLSLASTDNPATPTATRLFAHIQPSKFKLPTASTAPIILVAAGSGLAPFRGFIHERARLAKLGRPVGATRLFFGCRSATEDFLYKDETETLQSELGDNLAVHTAFSRSSERNVRGGKVYVQDRIAADSAEVVRLLRDEGAYFYICGSAAMAREVAAVVGECLKGESGMTEAGVRLWSEMMKKSRRWQEDVWG